MSVLKRDENDRIGADQHFVPLITVPRDYRRLLSSPRDQRVAAIWLVNFLILYRSLSCFVAACFPHQEGQMAGSAARGTGKDLES